MLTDSGKQANKGAQRRCFNQVTGVRTRNQTLRALFFNKLLTFFIICTENVDTVRSCSILPATLHY